MMEAYKDISSAAVRYRFIRLAQTGSSAVAFTFPASRPLFHLLGLRRQGFISGFNLSLSLSFHCHLPDKLNIFLNCYYFPGHRGIECTSVGVNFKKAVRA
jgi:hypothetical protein